MKALEKIRAKRDAEGSASERAAAQECSNEIMTAFPSLYEQDEDKAAEPGQGIQSLVAAVSAARSRCVLCRGRSTPQGHRGRMEEGRQEYCGWNRFAAEKLAQFAAPQHGPRSLENFKTQV